MIRRLLLVLLATAGAAGLGAAWAVRSIHAPGPLPAAQAVVVPRGGADRIAEALARAGVIDELALFRLAAYATRGDGALHAAELAFPAHASIAEALAVLRTGRPVQHRLTIPEGLTAKQIAAVLAAGDALSGPVDIPGEAYVLPQTYAFERDATRSSLVGRAHSALLSALDAEWAARDPDEPLASRAEALTLASIVERETARPEERPHVAAVFLNRLRRGMRLQSDPTVAYVAGAGDALGRELARADLDRDDPYNTYRIAGLPPGPICAPGLASLHAALHPDATDDLYFVADGAGGHVFARTLAEHQRNVARWRAASAEHAPG